MSGRRARQRNRAFPKTPHGKGQPRRKDVGEPGNGGRFTVAAPSAPEAVMPTPSQVAARIAPRRAPLPTPKPIESTFTGPLFIEPADTVPEPLEPHRRDIEAFNYRYPEMELFTLNGDEIVEVDPRRDGATLAAYQSLVSLGYDTDAA